MIATSNIEERVSKFFLTNDQSDGVALTDDKYPVSQDETSLFVSDEDETERAFSL